MGSTWDEKAVFLAAIELPPEERAAYLQTACPDDAARQRIESLLQHHETVTRQVLHAVPPGEMPSAAGMPSRIEEFQIIRQIGEGGMGVVYLAEDLILGRRVALKVLSPSLTGSEQALARFRTEARSTAAIKHPGIVPVYKFGFDGKTHYIASEYVDGPTLAEVIETQRGRRTGPVALGDLKTWCRQAAEMISAVADALDAAHRNQIIHRDVKPGNILIDKERGPRLTDFGIAKHLTEEARTNQTTVIGSCHYMSPEQASIASKKVDQRSDIFSLGVVLYELVALRRPFTGGTQNEILRALSEKDPVRLRVLDSRIPRDIEVICHKALEKHPADRYQTAGHIAADLRCFLDDRPILATPPSLGRKTRYWISKHRQMVLVAACALLAVTGLTLFWLLRAAHNETLAWFSVISDTPGAKVLLQEISQTTFEVDPEARQIGVTPIGIHRLPVGHYRITVQQPNGPGFVEFNASLFKAGSDEQIDYFVHDPGTSFQFTNSDTKSRHGFFLAQNETEANADMVLVEAGDYIVGWHLTDESLQIRRRRVSLPAFYIDKYEVSNAEYKQFIELTGYPLPKFWRLYGYDPKYDDHPVLGIPVEEAEAYARWRGKRLPTAWEWQAAMRTKEGWDYPWGNEWQAQPQIKEATLDDFKQLRSWDEVLIVDLGGRGTVPTRSHDPSVSKLGIVHGFGNVREITGSTINPNGVLTQGRSWMEPPEYQTLGKGNTYLLHGSDPFTGFRCAKSKIGILQP